MNKNILIFGLLFSFLTFGSCNFAHGSYPYSETYTLKIKETDLIDIIHKFKEDNPNYAVPDSVQLQDGRMGDHDYWYHVYFYYKSDNTILHTWVRQSDSESTIFALVAESEGLNLGNWRFINKDFSNKENQQQKVKFEQQILNIIRAKLKQNSKI